MNEIHIFANQVAISIVLVSVALFLAQRFLPNVFSKIIFCVVGFFVLLVPFLDFSLSGYVYALFGTPSVLLLIASAWSIAGILTKDFMFVRQNFGNARFWETKNCKAKNWQKENCEAKNDGTKSGDAKNCENNVKSSFFATPFCACGFFDCGFFDLRAKIVIFVVCLGVYLEFLGGIFSISGLLSVCGFEGKWLDFYYADFQAVVLWIFAFFAYLISKRFGVSLVCALLVYHSKILGDLPAWDYCFDAFLWAYCGVSVVYAFARFATKHDISKKASLKI